MTDPSLFPTGVAYTPAEELIINHIVEKPREFLLQSIQDVAASLGISEATVSRFARHAGFGDFKTLKNAVAARSLGPADKMSASIDEGAGDVQAFLRQQRANIDRTLEGLDEESFAKAVHALVAARRIFLHGKGASACVAELLRFRLNRYGMLVELLPAGGTELMEGLVHAGPSDVLVTFGFQRVSPEGQALLDHGEKVGCTTGSSPTAMCAARDRGRRSSSIPTAGSRVRIIRWRARWRWSTRLWWALQRSWTGRRSKLSTASKSSSGRTVICLRARGALRWRCVAPKGF